jgi:aspartyl-tRNA(Asn)/glutamyl-tRNA(Gln) amidotransferase subunit B
MEEGSLRCDANVSVRKKGDEKLGTKVEVKNLNSIRNVKRAIEIEADRLIALLEKAEPIIQQTRSFDANNNTTFAIRDKEDADDYRYFAEPDLAPFHLEELFIERIKNTIPALPEERVKKYKEEFKLSEYDAGVLTEERAVSDYFESVASSLVKGESTSHLYKAAANWMLGPVKNWLNETTQDIAAFPITPSKLAELVRLVDQGKLSFSVASGKLFSQLLVNPAGDPEQMAQEQNLIQQSDSTALDPIIDKVLDKLADKVVEYKKGKKGLLALFVGEVMKQSKGKADPKIANQLILEKLK